MSHNEAISVVVRCRGRVDRENDLVSPNVVSLDKSGFKLTVMVPENGSDDSRAAIVLNQASTVNRTYQVDQTFGAGADQVSVFEKVALDMCNDFLKGYNCTIFAYGQTGSGKTHTMFGDLGEGLEVGGDAGIIPRCLQRLFDKAKDDTMFKCSFVEIYNEELRDLLNAGEERNLKIYEQQGEAKMVKIKGLDEFFIKDQTQALKYLRLGLTKRETQATRMNTNSSRSHTIFTIHMIKQIEGKDYQLAKFNLVDLAGSENVRKSGSLNQRAKEAGSINQSLLTLGKVINSLSEKSKFIPYRESKLTRILKDSLGGDTKTTLIATVSPTLLDLYATVSTLDYAAKAKNIQNTVQVGSIIKDQIIMSDLMEENRRLQMDLTATRRREGHIYLDVDNYTESILSNKILQSQVDELKLKNETLEVRLEETTEAKTKEIKRLRESIAQMEKKIVGLNNALNDQLKTGDKLKEGNHKIGEELLKEIEKIEQDRNLISQEYYTALMAGITEVREKLSGTANSEAADFAPLMNTLGDIEGKAAQLYDTISAMNSALGEYKEVDLSEHASKMDAIVELIHNNTDELRQANLRNDPAGRRNDIEESVSPTIAEFKASVLDSVARFSEKLFTETLRSTQKLYFEPISETYIRSQNFNNDLSKRLSRHKRGLEEAAESIEENDNVVKTAYEVSAIEEDLLKRPLAVAKEQATSLSELDLLAANNANEQREFVRARVETIFADTRTDDLGSLSALKERVADALLEARPPLDDGVKFPLVTRRSPGKRQKLA